MRAVHILLLMYLALLASVNARADDETVQAACAMVYVPIFKKMYEPLPQKDKFKHCAVSCGLTLMCGPAEATAVGVLKELFDLVGPGNADWADLKANRTGIRLALKSETQTTHDCDRQCSAAYPSPSQSLTTAGAFENSIQKKVGER